MPRRFLEALPPKTAQQRRTQNASVEMTSVLSVDRLVMLNTPMLSPVCHPCLRALGVVALLLLACGAGARLRALDASTLQAMVIVEGDEGRGSGFVVKMGDKTYLVTNSHVVRGNRNVKFKNLSNAEIATGPLEIADQADAVRAAVTGVAGALELEPQLDKINIGDEVIVAGNAEGAGVVREIPGKVVGIGPDRIEVDAPFVPGNSGSPILLKSTGKVIGVATYMKIPRERTGGKSPFSLNEVRRFGYRLDTVAKWITPPGKGRLLQEGMKLAEMESVTTAITAVLDSDAAYVTKFGSSSFVSKSLAQKYPPLAALSRSIEDFVKDYAAANGVEARTKSATVFFAKLKGVLTDDRRGLAANQFSGYYAVQFKETGDRFKEFTDWYDATSMPAYREAWLNSQRVVSHRMSAPPIDPAKFKLVLSDHVANDEPPDNCHHVTYPPDSQPPNLEDLYWTIVEPGGARRSYLMSRTSLRVRTPSNGTYRVFVEFRSADQPKVVSNVVEFHYTSGEAAKSDVSAPAGGK